MSISNFGMNARGQVAIRKILPGDRLDPTTTNLISAGTGIPTDNWFISPAEGFGLKESRATLQSGSFDATLLNPNIKGGNITASGSFTMNCLKEGQEWIYWSMLGGTWAQTDGDDIVTDPISGDVIATGYYLHTLTPDPDAHPGLFLLEKQITNMGTGGYKVFCNCYVDTFALDGKQDGIVKLTLSIFAEFATTFLDAPRQALAVPSLDDDYYIGHRGYVTLRPRGADGAYSGVITKPDYIKGFTLNVNNNLTKDGFTLREVRDASVFVSEVPYNRRTITGSLNCVFTSNADLENAYRTLNSMELVYELEENGYILRFIIPQIKLTDAIDPDLNQGDGFVMVDIPFTAIRHDDGSDVYDMKVNIIDKIDHGVKTWEDIFFV